MCALFWLLIWIGTMPKQSDVPADVMTKAPDAATSLRARSDIGYGASLLGGAELSRATEGKVITSIRGLDDPSRSVATFSEVVRGSDLSHDQQQKLEEVWKQARIQGRDVGVDLKALVPLLEQNPELLDKLHTVATSNNLFGIAKGNVSPRAFETLRSEFLVEVVRGAVDPKLLAQGETSTCTACKALSNTSAENILRISCDLAVHGQATTKADDHLRLGINPADFRTRLVPYAERVSGMNLQGNGEHTRPVSDITSRFPSFGMSLVYASLMEMQGGAVTSEEGQFCRDYTYMCRSLSGYDTACAGPEAKILVDVSGKAVTSAGAGVKEVSQLQYLDQTLARVGRDQDAREALTQGSDQGHSRGVLVDMKWTDINPDKDGTRRHGRHFLLATGVVNDGGQEWYRLENPIGDYIKGKGSAGTLERSYAPGTVLGEKNSVWWKAGENGIVYVRKDVMEKNLVTVMVQYDTQYNASMEKPVTLLGTLKTQGTTYDAPIDFIRPTPRKVEPEQQKASESSRKALPEEEDKKKTLAELALEQQIVKRAKDQNADDMDVNLTRARQGKKDEKEIISEYDEQQDRGVKEKGDANDNYASFFSSATPNQSQSPTPPPAPTVSPAELERQRATT